MIRVIKRYESRKLYDTEESRYISLEDIARWVRDGQEIQVIDNSTSDDVTPQVLTQIILDEGKKGTSFLPTELLHELVRAGERAVVSGVEQVQGRMDRLVQKSIDRLAPVRRAREEMSQLRDRLSQLENTLHDLESQGEKEEPKAKPAPRRRAASKTTKSTGTKSTGTKAAATKSTAAKTTRKPAARKTTRKSTASAAAGDKKTATAGAASAAEDKA